MRTMLFTIAAAAATLAAPSLASAQNYGYAPPTQGCQQSLNNNRLAGGVIGAVGGAVIGKQIAGRNARSEGTVLGAVLGAVAGSEIGRRRVACDDFAYRGSQPVQRQSGFNRNGYGYSQYQVPSYNNGYQDNRYQDHSYQATYRPPVAYQQQCGWGQQSVQTPNGQVQSQNVWMCQANDGNWYPANR
jgi:Glycine zipper 2TM domain